MLFNGFNGAESWFDDAQSSTIVLDSSLRSGETAFVFFLAGCPENDPLFMTGVTISDNASGNNWTDLGATLLGNSEPFLNYRVWASRSLASDPGQITIHHAHTGPFTSPLMTEFARSVVVCSFRDASHLVPPPPPLALFGTANQNGPLGGWRVVPDTAAGQEPRYELQATETIVRFAVRGWTGHYDSGTDKSRVKRLPAQAGFLPMSYLWRDEITGTNTLRKGSTDQVPGPPPGSAGDWHRDRTLQVGVYIGGNWPDGGFYGTWGTDYDTSSDVAFDLENPNFWALYHSGGFAGPLEPIQREGTAVDLVTLQPGWIAAAWLSNGSDVSAGIIWPASVSSSSLIAENAASDAAPTITRGIHDDLLIAYHTTANATVIWRSARYGRPDTYGETDWELQAAHNSLKFPRLYIAPNGIGYLAAHSATGLRVYRTLDYGLTLEDLGLVSVAHEGRVSLWADLGGDLHLVYRSITDQLIHVSSADGGETWSEGELWDTDVHYPAFAGGLERGFVSRFPLAASTHRVDGTPHPNTTLIAADEPGGYTPAWGGVTVDEHGDWWIDGNRGATVLETRVSRNQGTDWITP